MHLLRSGWLSWVGVTAVLALTLSVPQLAYGQGVVGTVRYEGSGEVLAGVFVSVLEPGGERIRGVLTDAAGRFRIEVPMGRYQLQAERIGLQTESTNEFDLNTMDLRLHVIEMVARPVEIAGLVVDARVRSCRLEQGEALQIQRWWTEIKTALGVSAALQRERFGHFLVERFEEEWDGDLSQMIASDRRFSVSTSTRPFEAAPAEELIEKGFVQGDFGPERQYYGPDADVLLSGAFLRQRCFSLVKERGRNGQVGLHFEPLEGRAVADIEGTLWVDTMTAELKDLDFNYVNVVGPEGDHAGGEIVFQYLESGAWIVSNWSIRIPQTGLRGRRRRVTVLGYRRGGGSVISLSPNELNGRVGVVRGTVVDHLRGGGLAGATVMVLGTTRQTVTGEDGSFSFLELPVGKHYLAYTNDDMERWGLHPAYVSVDVLELVSKSVQLNVPSFKEAALALCLRRGVDAESLVIAHVVDVDGAPFSHKAIQLAFERRTEKAGQLVTLNLNTDFEGRFVTCGAPGGAEITVRVRGGGGWVDVAEIMARKGELTYREVVVLP